VVGVALSKGVAVPRLRRLRVGQVLSQRDLAARAGVAANTIGELEAGKRRAYPVTVRKLARALGVPPQELLGPPAGAGEEA
jgi:transcriptional regulator with XRE-family HTH domain